MLQDQFLEAVIQGRMPVTVYLVNGIRLQGQVDSFDRYGLVLSSGTQQFVYKHAISTIVPLRDFNTPAQTEAKPVVQAEPIVEAPKAAPSEEAPRPAATVRLKRTRTPHPPE